MISARYRIYCTFTVGYFYMNDLYMVHYEKDSRQLFKVTGNMENEIKSKLKWNRSTVITVEKNYICMKIFFKKTVTVWQKFLEHQCSMTQ